jgi:hypothetical protein
VERGGAGRTALRLLAVREHAARRRTVLGLRRRHRPAELSEERCWVGRDVDAHPQIRLAVDVVVRRDEKKNPAAL